MPNNIPAQSLRHVKRCMWIMIIGLFLSGVTAFPIETELAALIKHASTFPPYLAAWLQTIYNAIKTTNQNYPYLSYGTDWLAFAHIMLALLFVGPLRNPVKNIWVIEFGMMACVSIFALAFIAGPIRHIPLFWSLIDSSFGVIGLIPLTIAYRIVKQNKI